MTARRILLAALLAVALIFPTTFNPTPAAAYYGEIEGYRAINGSFSGQGCQFTITVMNVRRVQVYCQLRNGASGVVMNKTNFWEYDCWEPWGCVHSGWITGYDGWHPIGLMTMKKDGYCCLHAIINYAGPR